MKMNRKMTLAFLSMLIFSVVSCQSPPDQQEEQEPLLHDDLGRNYFSTTQAFEIPCCGSRTSKYTNPTVVVVIVDQVCTDGEVKIEVITRRGTTEQVEWVTIVALGGRRYKRAKAGDASAVDVPRNSKLKITCEGGTSGSCKIRLRKGRHITTPGQSSSVFTGQVTACAVASESEFRNFSGTTQRVKIVFESVCANRGGRPLAPTYFTRRMATAETGRPNPGNLTPGTTNPPAGTPGNFAKTIPIQAGDMLGGIKCRGRRGECKFRMSVD